MNSHTQKKFRTDRDRTEQNTGEDAERKWVKSNFFIFKENETKQACMHARGSWRGGFSKYRAGTTKMGRAFFVLCFVFVIFWGLVLRRSFLCILHFCIISRSAAWVVFGLVLSCLVLFCLVSFTIPAGWGPGV